jgi:uncharacterized protein with HEPN domain
MRKNEVSNSDRLHYILDAVNFILFHTVDVSEDDFYNNGVLKKAIVHDLQLMGEAANLISDGVKEKYTDIEWKQIINTRHRMIHEYFLVNYKTVWEIIKNDLPVLKEQLTKIIRNIS